MGADRQVSQRYFAVCQRYFFTASTAMEKGLDVRAELVEAGTVDAWKGRGWEGRKVSDPMCSRHLMASSSGCFTTGGLHEESNLYSTI